MRHRRFDPVFPDNISDETASVLSEVLHQLAAATCDKRSTSAIISSMTKPR
jgi:hypothetical protein